MDTADEFLAVIDQILSSDTPLPLLLQIAAASGTEFEANYALAFAYRIQAIGRGIAPTDKAAFYRNASDAFQRAARSAGQTARTLAEARHLEHEAFALITEAGYEESAGLRLSTYEKAGAYLERAAAMFPVRHTKTRHFLLGWRLICRGKTLGLQADLCRDLATKSSLHKQAACCFADSAQEFRDSGQGVLAAVSQGWQSFSSGWSLLFRRQEYEACRHFREAIHSFDLCGRADLALTCLQSLRPLGLDLLPEGPQRSRPDTCA
jgi:hypothetical protein